MRPLLLRGIRLLGGPDPGQADLLIEDGVVTGIGSSLRAPDSALVCEREGSVVAPAFLDLHCHLREPGQPWKERVATATAAAAAGGFGAVCAMANLRPPVDHVSRLRECQAKNRALARIPVLQFATCTKGLEGAELTDIAALGRAGAVGFSDDGRNGMPIATLTAAIEATAEIERLVAVHPEDETVLADANSWGGGDPTSWLLRPREAEQSAVAGALESLRRAGRGRLHLQHLTTAPAVELVRSAKREGLAVTAEVTPHHLTLGAPVADPEAPDREITCNPPLRGPQDRQALWDGLLDGTIDAIASDHAPHEIPTDPLQRRAPGFSGVQTALSAVLSDRHAKGRLDVIISALTSGPTRVLGDAAGSLPLAEIREGVPAHLVWFDPETTWVPDASSWRSLGSNTPFWRQRLSGVVLATFSRGRLVHFSPQVAEDS